jgi:NAD(P)-dependent dehydrogenase (short-subunit alcohol dehydrogenase family)
MYHAKRIARTGRFGEAVELAYAALYLASDESSYITGTDFLVDGGITAAYVTPLGPTTTLPTFRNASGV